jgi:Pyruvate/2-oxoacid:ferredoxin oxidoreductase gamma subunit
MGNARATNLILLGAYVGITRITSQEEMTEVIQESFTRKPKFIPINVSAFIAGWKEGNRLRREHELEMTLEEEDDNDVDSTYAYSNG